MLQEFGLEGGIMVVQGLSNILILNIRKMGLGKMKKVYELRYIMQKCVEAGWQPCYEALCRIKEGGKDIEQISSDDGYGHLEFFVDFLAQRVAKSHPIKEDDSVDYMISTIDEQDKTQGTGWAWFEKPLPDHLLDRFKESLEKYSRENSSYNIGRKLLI